MRFFPLTALVLLLSFTATAHAAPLPPRPYSGCGVLMLQPVAGPQLSPIVLYAEPGLQRIAELEIPALPRLAGDKQEPLVAVSATRGDWLQLAYDDAGREGWIEPPRSWEYRTWEEFLPKRTVRVFPGMKKILYALRGEPREGSSDRGVLTRDQQVRVIRIQDDWALLQAPSGWFRWRDGDGRLTVAP
jgi:hypothetical protein